MGREFHPRYRRGVSRRVRRTQIERMHDVRVVWERKRVFGAKEGFVLVEATAATENHGGDQRRVQSVDERVDIRAG